MAKILGVYEQWRCSGCKKVGAKIKLEGPNGGLCRHVKRYRNRMLRRLGADGWKFQSMRFRSGRKGRRSWCPECREREGVSWEQTDAGTIARAMKLASHFTKLSEGQDERP